MSLNPQGPIPNPDLSALLMAHKQEIFSSLRCHAVGSIVSFNAETQTASVQIAMKAVVFNQPQGIASPLQNTPTLVDYPVLTDVPVFVSAGGPAVITMPVAAGDSCLLKFNDRDLDAWFQSGAAVAPNSARMHSLSDALAIVGFRSRANPVPDYSPDDLEIRLANGLVAIRADGSAEIVSDSGASLVLKADGNLSLTNDAGTLLDLEDKVRLANGSGSLRAAMDLVITALTALNGKTGPSAAAQILAAQTALQALLET
jgi:hypothetical protein